MGEKILVELAERHRIHNRAENKSPKTLEWHETAVKRFCQFVESWKGSEATLSDLNPDNVKLFIVHLQETPTSHNHPFIAHPTKRVPIPPSTPMYGPSELFLASFTKMARQRCGYWKR